MSSAQDIKGFFGSIKNLFKNHIGALFLLAYIGWSQVCLFRVTFPIVKGVWRYMHGS